MARILLAEDDESMRTYICRALERAGYSVTAVDRGTAALPLVATGEFDLLLTDIVMPEKEGLETILSIRRTMTIPIIAISGGGRNLPMNYLKAAAKFGANYAFTKPIDRKAFLAAVDETLSKGA